MDKLRDIGRGTRMIKIGITGGVGSGKSQVLAYLEEIHHARICQADLIAHELQRPKEKCWRKIREYFGEGICNPDGTIDRKKLGTIVFSDAENLSVLNAIVHPAVNGRIRRLIAEEEKKGTGIFVLEAALMTEPVYREMMDEIWYIYAEKQVRFQRLRTDRGYSDEKTASMMSSQVTEETYRDFCDLTIDNSREFEKTKVQIDRALSNMKNRYDRR